MASPSPSYRPRQPASGVLFQVVRDHFETFRRQAANLRDGEGLPGFVEQEFRKFLQCGSLGGGFARFRCPVGSTGWCPFRVMGAGSVRAVAGGAWPSALRISSTRYFLVCPYGNGC